MISQPFFASRNGVVGNGAKNIVFTTSNMAKTMSDIIQTMSDII